MTSNDLPTLPLETSSPRARPAPFVLAATDHGTLIVNRNDYNAERQFGVAFQLFNRSSYDADEVKLALMALSWRKEVHGSGIIAVDCGANIGVHTVEWARHTAHWGTVIGIEAQERLYYSLCGNININNCLNARAILAAVGSKSGIMRIPVPDYCEPASYGSLELRKRKGNEFIGQAIDYSEDALVPVNTISIDELDLVRLDFLKIDVEGMEMEALSGAEKTISRWNPIILVEIIKSDEREITNYLRRHGYRYFRCAGNLLAVEANDPALGKAIALADIGFAVSHSER